MNKLFCVCFSIVLLAGCASSAVNKDPYPGSGGLFMGTPSAADIKSGRSVFEVSKFSSFKIGVTTKQEVVDNLGKPAYWTTDNNSSSLWYDYVRKESFMGMSEIVRATFTFDEHLILSKVEYPGSEDLTKKSAINPAEYEKVMLSFIQAAKNNNENKLITLTSPETRRKQGDAALALLYKNDTIPLFSRFKVTKRFPGKYTKDEFGNDGYIFTMLLTNEKNQSAPIFIAVLKENGNIYVSAIGVAK